MPRLKLEHAFNYDHRTNAVQLHGHTFSSLSLSGGWFEGAGKVARHRGSIAASRYCYANTCRRTCVKDLPIGVEQLSLKFSARKCTSMEQKGL